MHDVIAAMTTDAVVELVVGTAHRCPVVPGMGRRRDGDDVGQLLAGRLLLGRRVGGGEGLGDGLVLRAVRIADTERAERVDERLLRACERHAVLRASRPCERRLDVAEIELDDLRVGRVLARVVPEEVLLAVRLDERDALLRTPGQPQVVERYAVDREEAAGRAVLGRHVPDRCPVGEWKGRKPLAEVLDELPDDAGLAQDLRHRQHEVGRGRALGQRAAEPEADDLRDEHRERLAEHRRLGLDAADAPAEHAEPVHHRRVRVGADERVGKRGTVALLDDACEVLEVHLVADAGARRHDLEAAERLLPPAQEEVALMVALELELDVAIERHARRERVDLHEWSITSSAGMSGLIIAGSPPRSAIAFRIAARSTTAGTPVRSCSSTRDGANEISSDGSAFASQRATASTSLSSPLRRTFSSRTRSVYGSRATS